MQCLSNFLFLSLFLSTYEEYTSVIFFTNKGYEFTMLVMLNLVFLNLTQQPISDGQPEYPEPPCTFSEIKINQFSLNLQASKVDYTSFWLVLHVTPFLLFSPMPIMLLIQRFQSIVTFTLLTFLKFFVVKLVFKMKIL